MRSDESGWGEASDTGSSESIENLPGAQVQKQQLAFDQGELSQIDQGRGRVGGGNRVRAGESLLYEPVTTLLPIESFPISQFPKGNKNITRRLSAKPRFASSLPERAFLCFSLSLSLFCLNTIACFQGRKNHGAPAISFTNPSYATPWQRIVSTFHQTLLLPSLNLT